MEVLEELLHLDLSSFKDPTVSDSVKQSSLWGPEFRTGFPILGYFVIMTLIVLHIFYYVPYLYHVSFTIGLLVCFCSEEVSINHEVVFQPSEEDPFYEK